MHLLHFVGQSAPFDDDRFFWYHAFLINLFTTSSFRAFALDIYRHYHSLQASYCAILFTYFHFAYLNHLELVLLSWGVNLF